MLTQCNYSSFECTVHVLQVLVCTPHLLRPKFSDSIYHMSSEHTLPKTTISDLSTLQHWHSPVLFERTLHQPLGAGWKEGKPSSFLLPLFFPFPSGGTLGQILPFIRPGCSEPFLWRKILLIFQSHFQPHLFASLGERGTDCNCPVCTTLGLVLLFKKQELHPTATCYPGEEDCLWGPERGKVMMENMYAPAVGWYSSLHS